jgi:hypothetical protein
MTIRAKHILVLVFLVVALLLQGVTYRSFRVSILELNQDLDGYLGPMIEAQIARDAPPGSSAEDRLYLEALCVAKTVHNGSWALFLSQCALFCAVIGVLFLVPTREPTRNAGKAERAPEDAPDSARPAEGEGRREGG